MDLTKVENKMAGKDYLTRTHTDDKMAVETLLMSVTVLYIQKIVWESFVL